MNFVRRLLQVVALVGTLIVGTVALALIVSQTPWFRDWLRRYIVRESKQYLNGELTIGRLGGNLFFGVQLSDVAVNLSGERVVAVKGLEVDYNVFTIVSKGVVLDEIKLVEPRLRIERDGKGWNIGQLVKEQRKEADREGPGRPVELQSIEIADGILEIDENGGANGYKLPNRIEDLDVRAGFEYAPVHYSIDIDNLSFKGRSPQLALQQLKGQIAVRDDNLYLEDVTIRTAESSITLDGVVETYLRTPVMKLTTTANVSLPEIGRIVPAVSGYQLRPALHVTANGPADLLALDLDVRSEAGSVRGQITADVQAPGLGVKGQVHVEQLNLAPLLKDPAQRSNITGTARLNVDVASAPDNSPIIDRLSGSFQFDGPRVQAAGYEATKVHASGGFSRGRITLDARAAAYGGTATAAGFIVPPSHGRPVAFDLRGSAQNVNLKNLPASTRVPNLETNLSIAEYRVNGSGRTLSGNARLNRSTLEGATIVDGTVAEFGTNDGAVTYAARGGVENVNLQRIGTALKVSALAKPEFESDITGSFDVRGAGTSIDSMTLDASGTLTDASIMGARLSGLAFETHLANAGLEATVKGGFEGLDPARLTNRQRAEGLMSGSVDAHVKVADLRGPITPDSITAKGRLALRESTIGELEIQSAEVVGEYAARVGDIAKLNVVGPDLALDVSGRVALNHESQSNLKYHVEASDLALLGRLAGQSGLDGSVIVDGALAGNAASLQATGTLDGSNLTYQNNNALDLNSKFDITVPNLSFGDATAKGTTTAKFVQVGRMQINLVEATTTYVKQTLDFSTLLKERTRELEAKGKVIFHPDHQEIHLPAFALRTQGQEWRSAVGTEATVRYGGNRVAVQNVKLVSGDQTISADGTFALKDEDPAGTLKVGASNVDLAQLEQLLMQQRGFAGRLSADATISGTAKQPIVDGHIEILNGAFRDYKYESLKADIDYKGNRVDLDATLQQSPTEAITARGTVSQSLFSRSKAGHVAATAEDLIDLHIKSTDLSLGFIQGFTTLVTNVTGTMQADVRVTGSGYDPHLEGFVDIKNGAFGVPLGGVSYTGLHTRIDLAPDTVRIQSFTILDEHGEALKVSGQLAVHEKQVGAVDIAIQSDNFEVIDNELGDLGLDSDLKITGELRRPKVHGQVRVEAGRIEVDELLQLFHDPYATKPVPPVVSAERTVESSGSAEEATKNALAKAEASAAAPKAPPGPEPEEPPASAFDPVELDVDVVIPDNLVLRGKDLRPGGPTGTAIGDMNITIGGDLRVHKPADGQLALSGVVTTIRGTYEFQGRRFDLVRGGTLRFTGDPKPNPILNITAQRLIPNTGVEARIHITGTPDAPELRLESTPPLEESDILALIVFNRQVNELGTGERASLAATAGGIASGFLAAPLGDSIGRALDLDLFEITTTTDSGELGAGVTIGQQIGDRAFFKVRQEFGDQNLSEFMLEYQLAKFLRLQTSAAPETSGSANRLGQRRIERAGIDLIFFFSY
jgi:autotransporter translocation and assembly factor TamB